MRLVMTLLVRDEDDIVAANLAYHLARGVDFAIVTDNLSVDRTPAILGRFEAAGRIRVIREERDDYAQGRWVTRMARLAAIEHGADWVINADADEFWWPRGGDLKAALDGVPDDVGVVPAPRHDFVPVADDGRPFHARMTVRHARSVNAMGRPLPPKVAHRAHPRASVQQGNHALRWPRFERLAGPSPIEVLHFPLRTYRQFENKIVKGGRAYRRNRRLRRRVGATWRHLYELYERGELADYYARQEKSAPALAAGIDAGELVRDERLHRLLERLPES